MGIVKDLVGHPFSFAAGAGVANGLLAVARGKRIEPKTAVAFSVILGLGELALVMFEPPSERGPYSLNAIGWYSVLGVLAGVLPFVTWTPGEHGTTTGVPIASRETTGGGTAVSGYSRKRMPQRRRQQRAYARAV